MANYKVFNAKNASVKVSDEDLDREAAGSGPVPTEIANAAAMARRRDLTERVMATLGVENRRQQFAAARALLAFDETPAIPALEAAAAMSSDTMVAAIFRATSLRLGGPELSRAYFTEPDGDPLVKSMLVVTFDGYADLASGDLPFLGEALRCYLKREQDWVRHAEGDVWSIQVDTIVTVLASEQGPTAAVPGAGEPPRRAVSATREHRIDPHQPGDQALGQSSARFAAGLSPLTITASDVHRRH
jgi:hypothetical protein